MAPSTRTVVLVYNPRMGEGGKGPLMAQIQPVGQSTFMSSQRLSQQPQTEWLINNRYLSPTGLEAGSPRLGYQHSLVLERALFHSCNFLPRPHVVEESRELSGISDWTPIHKGSTLVAKSPPKGHSDKNSQPLPIFWESRTTPKFQFTTT